MVKKIESAIFLYSLFLYHIQYNQSKIRKTAQYHTTISQAIWTSRAYSGATSPRAYWSDERSVSRSQVIIFIRIILWSNPRNTKKSNS